jgi:transposase
MESTGCYWKPIDNLLEAEGLGALVANAQHIKAVPGRKTDVKDAEWIADLLRHGLLKASFIPDRDQRELAELVRYRRSLVEMRSAEVNRIQEVLEGANIKLGSVVSNVTQRVPGVSGRAMLERLAAGEEDPAAIAALAHHTLRAGTEELTRALRGVMGDHQRWLLTRQLGLVDELNRRIAEAEAEIGRRLAEEEAVLERLATIPGVGRQTAREVVAIVGTDMGRFPTHRHLASWAKLCPGLHESGGRKAPAGIGPGHKLLRATLTEAARSQTYLGAQYRRIARRRGGKRAAIAVAHSILVLCYHIIKDGTTYEDLGPNYFDERDKEKVIRRCTQRIEQLGKHVTVTDAA